MNLHELGVLSRSIPTMTDDQIKLAARRLCKLRNMHPDGFVTATDNFGGRSRMYAWQSAVTEIRQHLQVAEAIRLVAEEEERGNQDRG